DPARAGLRRRGAAWAGHLGSGRLPRVLARQPGSAGDQRPDVVVTPRRTLVRTSQPIKGNSMATLASAPEETTPWEKVRPRHIAPGQWKKFEGYNAEIFQAFGMNLDTPGTLATPGRYLNALFEATAGYVDDPQRLVEMLADHQY